jgi:hypothetical protein
MRSIAKPHGHGVASACRLTSYRSPLFLRHTDDSAHTRATGRPFLRERIALGESASRVSVRDSRNRRVVHAGFITKDSKSTKSGSPRAGVSGLA